MVLDLAWILDAPIEPGTKGLPDSALGRPLRDLAETGWHLLGSEVPMPVAILKRSAVAANAAAMQHFLQGSGAQLAPHGKTTMCPQLFERQLAAGAWGITVATVAQAQLCHAVGVPRILIANEVTGDAEAAMLARLCAATPERRCLVLVDSLAGAECLQRAFHAEPGAAPIEVLIEIGFPGGRCGVRDVEEAVALARSIAGLDRLALRGIEGYEGLVVTDDPLADTAWVRDYLVRLVDAARRVQAEGLLAAGERMLLSAGGSVYYDLVAALTQASIDADIIVRSGCYLTQDSGFYRRAMAQVAARAGEAAPRLVNALEVWARVLSTPEPGRAILSAGKRDLSCDIDLPRPESWFRAGTHQAPQPITGWSITKLSDQHAFADRTDGDAPELRVGDLVGLGLSHPCTTFDKWRVLLEVDDDYRVVGGLKTFF